MTMPRSYVLCGTPRSGSTLLCDLLEGVGLAGRPASYFRAESIPRWAERLKVQSVDEGSGAGFDQSYLDAVILHGRAGGDVFGLRLMWENHADLLARLDRVYPGETDARARLKAAFGPTLFIHLSRADKVAQAVSRVRAMQSGLWHLAADGSERERTAPAGPDIYDGAAIGAHVDRLTAEDAAWVDWFASNAIAPLRIVYEQFSREPRQTLATVLSALGLDPALALGVEPKTARMRDGISEEWAARSRSESAKGSGLPAPGGACYPQV